MARTSSPPVATKHVLQQGAVLAALGRTALLAIQQRRAPKSNSNFVVPGPEITIERPPLPRDLIDAYVHHLGSDPKSYRGIVPPHLFPQWCMPALARTLEGLPYPIMRVVNGGCFVHVLAPMPDNEPITVRAQLTAIEDDGSRAVLKQTVITGTTSVPLALRIEFTAVVPLASGGDEKKPNGVKKDKARVPQNAHEVTRELLSADAGLSFAKLTGDFNPIHWLPVYAKASGFRNVILHGFGTFARAWEGLTRGTLGGDVRAISSFEARLTRPLVLPHEVGLYTVGNEVFVGDAPGGPAYLTGTYTAGN